LIKFNVSNLETGSQWKAYLNLKAAKSEEIPLEYTIFANAISGSWEMGIGTRFDNISTQGVTWNYREGDSKLDWLENNFNSFTSASQNNGGGGTWWTQYEASQSFSYQTADIDMNVKSLLKSWMSGSIKNDGIILRHAFNKEVDTQDYGAIKLFSKETNTIYQPKIRIGWDDQLFITGSLNALTSEDIKVGVTNLKAEVKVGTTPKIRIFTRELYPIKTFVKQFAYSTLHYLPATSYYQIKDYTSDDIIIPFSDYSKISCDVNGNYINLNLSNWEADRTYKIEFKVTIDGNTQYFDDDITFRIVKN
jgi:hypothetical protein